MPVRPFFGRATSATVTIKSVRNRPVSGRLACGPKGGANFVPLQMGGEFIPPSPSLLLWADTQDRQAASEHEKV